MNISNVTNYKPKDFVELSDVFCQNIVALGQRRNSERVSMRAQKDDSCILS